jgi:TRAP-type C4-dicarboxylate transport system substrate-binding protein
MKRNRFWRIFCSLGLVLLLVLSVQVVNSDAAGEKVTWTFATNPGPAANTWSFHPYPRFQNLLERNSGGRFILKTKVGLYPPKEVIHAVKKGAVEMGWERTPWLSGTFPLWDLSLPFFWDNVYEYEAFLNDPRIIAIDRETFGEHNLIKIAEIQSATTDGIFAKKPIKTLDDFKGLKVRTAGTIPTFALKLMGASPLTIATTEILEALQRGTVDAIQTSRGWGMGFGLPDVATHVSIWSVQSVFSGMLIVNKEKFEALPKDLQKVLIDTGREMQGQNAFGAMIEEKESVIGAKVSPMEIVFPDKTEVEKARKLCKPVIKKWIDRAGPRGEEVLSIAAEYASGAKVMMGK